MYYMINILNKKNTKKAIITAIILLEYCYYLDAIQKNLRT